MNNRALVSQVTSSLDEINDSSIRINQFFEPLPAPPRRIYIQKKKLAAVWRECNEPLHEMEIHGSDQVFVYWIERLIKTVSVSHYISPSPSQPTTLPLPHQLLLPGNSPDTLSALEKFRKFLANLVTTRVKKIRKLKQVLLLRKCLQLHSRHRSHPGLSSKPHFEKSAKFLRLVNYAQIQLKNLYFALHEYVTIHAYFIRKDLNDLTLKQIHRDFCLHAPFQLSLSKFRKISYQLGLSYKTKTTGFDNSQNTLQLRKHFVSMLIAEKILENNNFFFFDVCSIAETSLKRKIWTYKHFPNRCKRKFTYNLTHLLFAITATGKFYYQFVKGHINAQLVLKFFDAIWQREKNEKRSLVILLDNAPMHKSPIIKDFSVKTKVMFIFFPKCCPFFNMSELVFRYIKTDLRKKIVLK